jgi:molybdenum cofactor cytidylyltransferase
MGEETAPRLVAIVPAAGRSARMGTPKQLLPVNARPMVLGVIDALRAGGADALTLVVSSQLRDRLGDLSAGVRIVINDDETSEMIDSVRMGVATSGPCDGYLVCPSDAAGIAADDVRRCVGAFHQTPEQIIIASHAGRRGHPVIFPATLASVVRSRECDAGLNQLARNRPQLVRVVECVSPGTVTNVNTREDYERL